MTEHLEVLGSCCHCEINLVDWIEMKLFPDSAFFHLELLATMLKILLKCVLLYISLKNYQETKGGVFFQVSLSCSLCPK